MTRTLPTDPPVHVEQYPTHTNAIWSAPCTAASFLAACEDLGGVGPTSEAVVDERGVAGRDRRPLRAVDPGTVTYVRVEPAAPDWRASWEERSTPVVSIDGAFPEEACRKLHVATTPCRSWSESATEAAGSVFGVW